MSSIERNDYRILKNEEISDGIFELVIEAQEIAEAATPGQFLNIYLPGGAMLLPRPISISGADITTGEVSLIYAVVGEGTKALSLIRPDNGSNASIQSANFIDVLGPLGSGFLDYSKEIKIGKVILIGGGVGIPPLLFTAQRLRETLGPAIEIIAILGYREATWLEDRFTEISIDTITISENPQSSDAQNTYQQSPSEELLISTNLVPPMNKGNVIDLLNQNRDRIIAPAQGASQASSYDSAASEILALSCGPKPMLAAVHTWCSQNKIDLRVSLEERMGCGYGACAGCTTKTRQLNDPAKPQNGPNQPGGDGIIKKKICVHGPVFWADEVVW